MKRQVNARMSEATTEKLAILASRYGTQAEAVAVAIDRLYESEAGLIRVAKATGHNVAADPTTVRQPAAADA